MRSKRQRKQKDRFSLKVKQAADGQNGLDVSTDYDPNALILPSSHLNKPSAEDKEHEQQPKLSKSQQKKLRKVQEEKERKAARAQIMETLASHQLTDQELEMMRPAASLGQKETRRQAVKRAFKLEKAGIQAPSSLKDSRLVRQRRVVVAQDDDDDDDDSEEEDEEMDGVSEEYDREEAMPVAAQSKQQQQQEQPAKRQKVAPPASKDSLRRTVQAIKHDLGLPAPSTDHVKAKINNNSSSNKPPRVVHISRPSEIEAVRANLPIVGMEQEVMEAVSENDVVVLCGETGCGKTTQVPQFLLEAGYGCRDFKERAGGIAVTQPRRVAAVATARRVAEELGVDLGGSTVGYAVRHDVKLGENTAIKFMTDGVLLREVQEDFLLKKYSVVVVDEAHERSLNTDILLGLLSRVVRLRRTLADERDERMKDDNDDNNNKDEVYPLKLIIMSATLRTEDFIENKTLFASKPPLVSVPARQYPVTVHFSKKTEMEDYVGVAAKKVEQIHNQLPPGGILVFLTGQREVDRMCRQLKQSLTPKMKKKKKTVEESRQEEEEEVEVEELDVIGMDDGGGDAAEALDFDSRQQQGGGPSKNNKNSNDDDDDDRDDYELMEDVEDEEEVEIIGGQGFTADQIAAAEKEFEKRLGINLSSFAAAGTKKNSTTITSDGGDDISNNEGGGEGSNGHGITGVHVLPLYAALQPSAQAKVFQPTPPGHRLIIIATNVAETSLTIPGIRYVVDAGRSKQRLLESSSSGLARFDVRWISKASAEQRAGRAGRTGPGHCYRLFSSAVFNDIFPQHTPPEIKNTSLEGVALSLKSLGVDKVVNFPFPTPPEQAALKAAENCLVALGALHPQSLMLTVLGKQMAAFPIGPRHARMLLAASKPSASASSSSGSQTKAEKRGVLPYAIALAAVMSVDSPFLSSVTSNDNDEDGTKDEKDDDRDDDERQEEERRNTQAKKAQQAQGQFRLADSDALSALRALCAFETQGGGGESWCRKHHLHFRNLKEASALRRQLTRTVAASLSSLQPTNNNNNTTLPPPSTAVLVALRHALTAGWCDSVARRVRSIDHINKKKTSTGTGTGTTDNNNNNNNGRMRAIRYRSAILEDEDIYLHPNSNLSSTAPEYVVYTELIRTTKRPYMAGVTAIEPQWLVHAVLAQHQQQEEGGGGVVASTNTTSTIYVSHLCQLGPPLSDPPPTYLPNKDQVVCWREVRYGKHDWVLPHYVAVHPDVKERCALFAAALLEGKVLPGMKRLKTAMAMTGSSCMKLEMRAHWRVAELLGALERGGGGGGGVDSKAALREKWMQDPSFLRKELLSWMQKGTEAALLRMWDSLKQEAIQE